MKNGGTWIKVIRQIIRTDAGKTTAAVKKYEALRQEREGKKKDNKTKKQREHCLFLILQKYLNSGATFFLNVRKKIQDHQLPRSNL